MPGAPKIYFNGCSQIENGHLELETDNWESQSWPWLIANSLNAEFRNDAVSLGSNNRLLRTTIDAILEYKPDIVVAGITDANRIELPIANGDRCRINIHHCNTDNGSTPEQFQKNWYARHHNNWLSFCNTLQIVYQLKCLQKVHGFQLYLLNTVCDNNFSNWKSLQQDSFFVKHNRAPWRSEKEQASVQRLLDQIADLNWIIPWNESLYSVTTDNNWSTDQYGHPSLSSQELVYNLLKGKII